MQTTVPGNPGCIGKPAERFETLEQQEWQDQFVSLTLEKLTNSFFNPIEQMVIQMCTIDVEKIISGVATNLVLYMAKWGEDDVKQWLNIGNARVMQIPKTRFSAGGNVPPPLPQRPWRCRLSC